MIILYILGWYGCAWLAMYILDKLESSTSDVTTSILVLMLGPLVLILVSFGWFIDYGVDKYRINLFPGSRKKKDS
jgi:hypothetical protein